MFVAPVAQTYATRVPYITPDEFRAHPTGVDLSDLVPEGSEAVNDQALLNVIAAASSYADNLCGKVLAATVDTQAGAYQVARDGSIRVALDNSPVVAVLSVTAGLQPGSQIPLVEGPDWSLQGRVLKVPTSFGYFQRPDRVHATVRYVNGWANAELTADAAAGDGSLVLDNALGIVPGMALGVRGAAASETVTVDASFTPVSDASPAVVPLASPLRNAYTTGDTLSAFPRSIKLAVIMLAAAIVKTRGGDAIVMPGVNEQPTEIESLNKGATSELGLAIDLLSPFKRNL